MTSSLTRAGLTLAVALVLAIPVSGQGQQPSQSSAASQKAAKKVVPAPTAKASRDGGAMPQGFSIVLVLADLQAGPGEEDVPPAARKALLDMKDFLPYKSYRLLDAAWVLCCGSGQHRQPAAWA